MSDLVSVDQRGGQWLVASYSQTVHGFWVMNGWLRRLEADAPDEEIGTAVQQGLERSAASVEAPARDTNPAAPLLEMVGLRSYGAYMRGTRSIDVTREGNTVTIEPKRNEGPRGGFTPLAELAEVLDLPSQGELGKAIQEALKRTL